MTTSSGTQNVQQQSVSQPWAPAQGGLQSILSGTAGLNPQPTPTENAAIQQLQTNAGGIPNFGPTVGNAAASYLGGDPHNLINNAYSQYGNSISGLTNPNNLNPYNTPGFSQALNTLNQDITNQIQGTFAGAGRTGSGMDTQTLARGLSQGEGGLLQSQYNTNVGNLQNAAQNYFNAGLGTNQAFGQNVSAGANLGQATPGFYTQGPAAQLSAGQAPFNLTAGNLGILAGITDPIAALGGQTNTSGTQTGTYTPSTLQAIVQGTQAFGNLFGGAGGGAVGNAGSAVGRVGNLFG